MPKKRVFSEKPEMHPLLPELRLQQAREALGSLELSNLTEINVLEDAFSGLYEDYEIEYLLDGEE